MIKKNTENSTFNYSNMPMCSNSSVTGVKGEDETYCFKCNEDGKECTSTFVDAYATANDGAYSLADTREKKWKYYVNHKWVFGSMSNLEEFKWNFDDFDEKDFKDFRYPDPTNQEAFLKIYSRLT